MVEGVDIVAKFLRERGMDATIRDGFVSVKKNGIRRQIVVEDMRVYLCDICWVDLHKPDSLENVYKASIGCDGDQNGDYMCDC